MHRLRLKLAERLMPFLDFLHDPAVRDLAWAIGAPSLLDASYPAYSGHVVDDDWCRSQLETCAPWLIALDQQAHVLHDYLAARPTRRLGHYFESLLAFWLARVPDMHILATNLQVQDAQRTVGEYDFLLRDGQGKLCHWEAAVKFYLQAQPQPQQKNFIGPGGQDRLDLKLDRIFIHQLELGHSPAGRAALPGGQVLDKTLAFIKGYLFYQAPQPYQNLQAESISIPGISAAHSSGWWVHYPVENLPRLAADSHWVTLPRLRWLAPLRLTADAGVMQHNAIINALTGHFAASDDAVQVAEVTQDAAGEWREAARG
ncbi:MAG: DUF1853 family protein, partial [Gallionellaceae bacterium]|nr:DUF1853 family protein [Gallionellaceae bacterium]